MCGTLVSNGTLLPAGSCTPIRLACLPDDPAGDIQLACRATPIRASQPVNTLPADLACGAKCRPLRSGPRPVRRGSPAAPISACSAFSSVVRAYAMVGQANNAAICLMKVCAMARTQDTEKFLDTIGSGRPFFSAIEAPQNPLLGLDRAFTEIDSWWATVNFADLEG